MSTNLPVSGAPIPEDTDDVDAALDMAGLGTGLDSYVVGRFANTGDRDTARPGTPPTGAIDSIAGTPVVRRANAWRPVDLAGTLFAETNGSVRTLTSTGTDIGVTGTGITITLVEQRRVRVSIDGAFQQATATQGVYKAWPAYVAGSTATGGTSFGNGSTASGAGNGQYATFGTRATVLLAAGTWTLYIIAQRLSGGATSDSVVSSHIEVSDAGPS